MTKPTPSTPRPALVAPRPGPSIPVLLLAALVLFASLASFMRWMQGEALSAANPAPTGPNQPPPPQVADVHRAIQAMQLVTVTLDTTITVAARDESAWRGNIDATLRVPVRLYYGADFSRAKIDSLKMGPLITAYLVTVPSPRRIATETYPERESADVSTGWLRFRSIGGEYTLGMARRSIGEEARRMILHAEDEVMVREQTRQRVVQLVKAIAGDSATVTVSFDDAVVANAAPKAASNGAPEESPR